MQLVDTHCHIDIERHFPDFDAVLDRAVKAGVSDIVLAGVHRQGWQRLMALSRKHPELHAASGMHPMYLDYHAPEDLAELEKLAASGELVAIGEVGLDYHVENSDHAVQQRLFEAQIDIAASAGLPLLLHVRKAHDQVLATIRRKKFNNGGIVHAFNGSYQQATHYIKHGFMIGICGTVTYDRSRKIRKVASELPLEALVLETDSPDIPPSAHWGERNLPEYLPEVLLHLTQLRSEDQSGIAVQTSKNARAALTRIDLP
ncbi:TatD family hydrolase [Desulfosediminicola flagellatus]|uniref:TatD family hydrolase n=1 Tax=Desulfosediminicola flagellatus TaxID=2569541 RepID=UPI0010AC6466|nr:TatD family hydrolase [Desulfosediminicola flagellatus]